MSFRSEGAETLQRLLRDELKDFQGAVTACFPTADVALYGEDAVAWSEERFSLFTLDDELVSKSVSVAKKGEKHALADKILALQQLVKVAHATGRVVCLGQGPMSLHMIEKAKVPVVSELRRQLSMLKTTLAGEYLTRLDHDETLELPYKVSDLANHVNQKAQDAIEMLVQLWKAETQHCGETLYGLAPEWQPYRDTMLSNDAIARQLMCCDNFVQMNALVQALETMIGGMKALNTDGHGALIEARIIKDALDYKLFAVETICIAFALAQWSKTIQFQVNHMARAKMVTDLEAEVSSRGCKLPDDLAKEFESAKTTAFKVRRPEGDDVKEASSSAKKRRTS